MTPTVRARMERSIEARRGTCQDCGSRTSRKWNTRCNACERARRRLERSSDAWFWNQVDRNGPTSEYRPELGPCWLWLGSLKRGYGVDQSVLRGSAYAHRRAYELVVGSIPDGLELDHLCRVTNCVNPTHLEPVTSAENKRREAYASSTCRRGHPRTPENRYRHGAGTECKPCVIAAREARLSRQQGVSAA